MNTENDNAEVFLGRQAIFDSHLKVYGYELLFRDRADAENALIASQDKASVTVILNTFAEIGLHKVTDGKIAFINMTRNLLINFPTLPKDSVALEILEDIEIDALLLRSIEKLSKEGYLIVLDDFTFSSKRQDLIALANIIKIDIKSISTAELANQVSVLKSLTKAALLAEKVETHDELNMCKKLGFQYFQGYFLNKPNVLVGKKLASNQLVVMNLIARVHNPDVTMHELKNILSSDARLSYKLFKVVNSAAYTKVERIDSLQQAIMFLGLRKLKEWLLLISLSSIDDKPLELIIQTMIRAKMCGILAVGNKASVDIWFTTGLFSTLDALLDEDMATLLQAITIAPETKVALLEREGTLGKVLNNIIAYERGDLEYFTTNNIKTEPYTKAYLDSISWAHEYSVLLRAWD